MPSALTYPGVYLEEIPSGVRTITGVATSIAAFVGRAARGPTDADLDGPVIINSFGDFERNFGSLDPAYPMSYAVRDFYLNGGAQAVIVRLYKAAASTNAKAQIAYEKLPIEAASCGSWANTLSARVDTNVSVEIAALYGLAASDLFSLTVRDTVSGVQETFLNLTVKESPRRVDRVLKASSSLVRVSSTLALPATEVPKPLDPDPTKNQWLGVVAAGLAVDSDKLNVAEK